MVIYPLEISRSSEAHGRKNPEDWDRDASLIEKYVNSQLENESQKNPDWDFKMFTYSSIGQEAGLSTERVCDILFGVDCGYNGITFQNQKKSG